MSSFIRAALGRSTAENINKKRRANNAKAKVNAASKIQKNLNQEAEALKRSVLQRKTYSTSSTGSQFIGKTNPQKITNEIEKICNQSLMAKKNNIHALFFFLKDKHKRLNYGNNTENAKTIKRINDETYNEAFFESLNSNFITNLAEITVENILSYINEPTITKDQYLSIVNSSVPNEKKNIYINNGNKKGKNNVVDNVEQIRSNIKPPIKSVNVSKNIPRPPPRPSQQPPPPQRQQNKPPNKNSTMPLQQPNLPMKNNNINATLTQNNINKLPAANRARYILGLNKK